jgi:hypothetical protein
VNWGVRTPQMAYVEGEVIDYRRSATEPGGKGQATVQTAARGSAPQATRRIHGAGHTNVRLGPDTQRSQASGACPPRWRLRCPTFSVGHERQAGKG